MGSGPASVAHAFWLRGASRCRYQENLGIDTNCPVLGSSAGLSGRALSLSRGRARFLLAPSRCYAIWCSWSGSTSRRILPTRRCRGRSASNPASQVDGVSVRRDNGRTADVSSATSDLTSKRTSHPVKLVSPSSAPRAHQQTEWVVESRRAHAPSPGTRDSRRGCRDRHRAVNSHQSARRVRGLCGQLRFRSDELPSGRHRGIRRQYHRVVRLLHLRELGRDPRGQVLREGPRGGGLPQHGGDLLGRLPDPAAGGVRLRLARGQGRPEVHLHRHA